MDPADNPDGVDLVIDVNFDKAKALKSVLDSIDHGQAIVFNATMKNLHVSSANHLHLVAKFLIKG